MVLGTMRIGSLIATNLVRADRRPLTPAELADGLDALVEEGILAERAGFHSVHAPDRHGAPACALSGPEQLLTLLAHETAKVMLATFTFVATLVHPLKAAEQFAVIDNLSRGRLVTTVSRGFLPSFWGQFGIPEEKMLGRFLEAIKLWRAAFAGERFDFDGDHWTVRDGLLAPTPFQPGGWPLWSGGRAAAARDRRERLAGRDPALRERRGGLDVRPDAALRRGLRRGRRPLPRARAGARQGAVRRADARRLGGRQLRRGRARLRRALRAHDPLLPARRQPRPQPGVQRPGRRHAGERRPV